MFAKRKIFHTLCLLRKLERRNISWDVGLYCIHAFNKEFRLTGRGISKLKEHIDNYDEMELIIKKMEKPQVEIREEMTVAKRPSSDGKSAYTAMVEEKLGDIKEKFKLQTKLIGELFDVLQQKTEDLPNPDQSNSDDVKTVPPVPPLDIVDKGM